MLNSIAGKLHQHAEIIDKEDTEGFLACAEFLGMKEMGRGASRNEVKLNVNP
jgi:hypothetical protein